MGLLLINGKTVTVQDFVKKVEEVTGKKFPLEDLKNNQEFQYNQAVKVIDIGATKMNGGQKMYRQVKSNDVLAYFNYFDNNAGETITFRYVDRAPYENPAKPGNVVYDPKAIDFSGGIFSYEQKDLNLAIYMLCHPLCYDSPFYKEGSPYKYSHNNLKSESRKKREKISARSIAFQHATVVGEHELKSLAKGLGLPIPDSYDSEDIRADLQQYAMDNAEIYNAKTATETVKFEGMIIDSVDEGEIVLQKHGSISVWKFASGKRTGEQIMTVPAEDSNSLESLKTFLKQNIGEYYDFFVTRNKNLTADKTSEEFLLAKKNGAPDSFSRGLDGDLKEIEDFQSAKHYLQVNHPEGRQPSQANAKKFFDDIQSGAITAENVREKRVEYMPKSE